MTAVEAFRSTEDDAVRRQQVGVDPETAELCVVEDRVGGAAAHLNLPRILAAQHAHQCTGSQLALATAGNDQSADDAGNDHAVFLDQYRHRRRLRPQARSLFVGQYASFAVDVEGQQDDAAAGIEGAASRAWMSRTG